jgi:beta-glucosidase
MRKRLISVFFIILFVTGAGCDSGTGRPSGRYLDSRVDPEERARDLLTKMTPEEKVGQMTQAGIAFLGDRADIGKYCLGSLLSGGGMGPANNDPAGWAAMYDGFQDEALKGRIGIPVIYGADAVHGHNNVGGAVIFPHNIGLGATGDPELVEQIARATAVEVAATGIDWNFAPCVAVAQDERWGRTYEGFSEDLFRTKRRSRLAPSIFSRTAEQTAAGTAATPATVTRRFARRFWRPTGRPSPPAARPSWRAFLP